MNKLYSTIKKVLAPLRGLGLRRFAIVRKSLALIRPRTAVIHGMTMEIDRDDFALSEELISGVYEPFETEIAKTLMPKTRTMLDLGVNIGYYTLLFCKLVPSGVVYGFEPSPRTYKILERNVARNGFSARAHLFEMAAGDHAGIVKLYINQYNRADNRIFRSFDAKNKGVDVPIRRVDDVIEPGTSIDFIKMDIQGAEVLALRGMQRILAQHKERPMYILSECWPRGMERAGSSAEEYFDILTANGFSWLVIDEKRRALRKASAADIIGEFSRGRKEHMNLLCWRNAQLSPGLLERAKNS